MDKGSTVTRRYLRRLRAWTNIMAPRIGANIDELTFLRPDGEPVAVSAFLGKPLLLVFLRHLA